MKQKELFKLLDGIQEKGKGTVQSERILMIDGLNLFFRNFAVMNMVNPDGVHIGGLGGFFRSLGAMIRQTKPTQVYVVFDGAGSANNRKNINPLYKSGRDLQRITNWDAFDDKQDEDDSKVDQMVRVIQYLKTLPVKTISIDKVEADDIISYLSSVVVNKPEDKVFIVSSDKDFIQLVNDRISVWSPTKKKLYTPEVVREEFQVPSHNFVMYRVIDGDKSDNVPGIKGFGLKTLIKKVPKILEDNKITTDDLIAEGFDTDIINRNYDLMQLDDVNISGKAKLEIQHSVDENDTQLIKYEFQKMMIEDKCVATFMNLDSWLAETFNKLNIIARNHYDR